jgi:hypothetical protein
MQVEVELSRHSKPELVLGSVPFAGAVQLGLLV